jgi:hypothetical protein
MFVFFAPIEDNLTVYVTVSPTNDSKHRRTRTDKKAPLKRLVDWPGNVLKRARKGYKPTPGKGYFL